MKLDFGEIFASHVANTQKEWAHDRKLTVGASEVFGCIRKTFFKKRGGEFVERREAGVQLVENGVDLIDGEEYPHFDEAPVYVNVPLYPEDPEDEENWGASRRGDILEANFVVPAVSKHLQKGKLLFAGDKQKTLVNGYNSATPDGLIIGLDRDALENYGIPDIGDHSITFEIKSVDPRIRLKEAKPIHVGQVQTQIGLIREKTPYRPNYGVILYVNASFLDQIKVFVVKFNPEVWAAAKQRATTVFTVSSPGELWAEGHLDGECEFCPFTRSCAIVTAGTVPDDNSKQIAADEAVLAEFDPLAEEYQQAAQAAKDAERDFELVKQKVKDQLILIGSRKIGGKKMRRPYTFSWSAQKGRKSLSTELLKEALGEDLDAYKTEGAGFDVLRASFDE